MSQDDIDLTERGWKPVGHDRGGVPLLWHRPAEDRMLAWPGVIATPAVAIELEHRADAVAAAKTAEDNAIKAAREKLRARP